MATKTSQRVAIWIIAIVMTVGSLGVYFVAIIANKNNATDTANQSAASAAYQKEYTAYQAKVQAQADELSTQYFDTFNQYANEPAAFDAASVTTLATKDLKVGDGAEIKSDTPYSAYYIGWNPQGKVFDESINGTKLKAPISGSGLIEGWTKGVIGMKIGGVRELSIPSAQAYGATGSGADIPANTPIKFVVMAITPPAAIPQPAYPTQ